MLAGVVLVNSCHEPRGEVKSANPESDGNTLIDPVSEEFDSTEKVRKPGTKGHEAGVALLVPVRRHLGGVMHGEGQGDRETGGRGMGI